MSPREKHVPDDAHRTSVCLTTEDRAAIQWIIQIRRLKKDKRTTINDVLVDALWYFLERTEGKTKDQIRETIPKVPIDHPENKIAEMPRPKKKR